LVSFLTSKFVNEFTKEFTKELPKYSEEEIEEKHEIVDSLSGVSSSSSSIDPAPSQNSDFSSSPRDDISICSMERYVSSVFNGDGR
jgi:hypothetical protein